MHCRELVSGQAKDNDVVILASSEDHTPRAARALDPNFLAPRTLQTHGLALPRPGAKESLQQI